MFILDATGTFTQPVRFSFNGGAGRDDAEFTGTFKRLPASEIDQLVASATTDADLVRQVMVGWSGVTAPDQLPVPFSAEALDRLLEVPGLPGIVSMAFLEGARALPRKN